jgi:uncharacterized membrane protein affecting hemolysin expression
MKRDIRLRYNLRIQEVATVVLCISLVVATMALAAASRRAVQSFGKNAVRSLSSQAAGILAGSG